MSITNYNINIINQMIDSAIQQSSDGGSISLNKGDAIGIKEFLNSIDDSVDLLQIKAAYIKGMSYADRLSDGYLYSLIVKLQSFNVAEFKIPNSKYPWGDNVEAEIEKMLPLQKQFIEFFIVLYEYAPDNKRVLEYFKIMLQISYDHFESFQYLDTSGYMESDHLRNFIYEVFLYISTYLCKKEKLADFTVLINEIYLVKCVINKNSSSPITTYDSVKFSAFNLLVTSIDDEVRRERRNLMGYNDNLYSELVHSKISKLDLFESDEIILTDMLLYYISIFKIAGGSAIGIWIPYTAGYHKRRTHDFFLKSVSRSFFEKIIPVFEVKSLEHFKSLVPIVRQRHGEVQKTVNIIMPQLLDGLNIHQLCTKD